MYNLLWNHTNVDLNWLKDYWIIKMSNKIACLVGETIHSKSQTKTATRLKGRLFNIASTYEIDQNFSFMAE
jgi:hypothetical protein